MLSWSGMGRRPGRDGWFHVGEVPVTTTMLVVVGGVVSMLAYAINKDALVEVAYIAPLVREGELWRVATWPLVNPPSIWSAIGLVWFWVIGHMVEDEIGRKRQAGLLVAMTVVPAALVSLVPLTARTGFDVGVGTLSLGLFVAFAIERPDLRFLFGIPAWAIAAVIVGVNVLAYVGDRLWGALLLMLLVIVVGVAGCAVCGMGSRFPMLPRLGARGSRPAGAKRARGGRRRGRGKGPTVVAGPWTSPGGFAAPGPNRADAAELDALLDKISASGVGSLTPAERKRLEDLSKGLRDT